MVVLVVAPELMLELALTLEMALALHLGVVLRPGLGPAVEILQVLMPELTPGL